MLTIILPKLLGRPQFRERYGQCANQPAGNIAHNKTKLASQRVFHKLREKTAGTSSSLAAKTPGAGIRKDTGAIIIPFDRITVTLDAMLERSLTMFENALGRKFPRLTGCAPLLVGITERGCRFPAGRSLPFQSLTDLDQVDNGRKMGASACADNKSGSVSKRGSPHESFPL